MKNKTEKDYGGDGVILCNNSEQAVNNISKDSNVVTASTAIHLPQVQQSSSVPTKDEHSSMLRNNQTSINNETSTRSEPASFLGFGEYEERRKKYINERIADYKEYLRKQKENSTTSKTFKSKTTKNILNEKENKENLHEKNLRDNRKFNIDRNLFLDHKSKESKHTKSVQVQTDIQGIDLPLVVNQVPSKKASNSTNTDNVEPANTTVATNTSTPEHIVEDMNVDNPANQLAVKIDKVQIGTQNIIVPERHVPSSSFTYLNPRSRLLADLKHSYLPSFADSSSNDTTTATSTDDDEYKLKKLKWEKARQRDEYHEELRKQIEEKQRMALERAERERRQEEALTKRLERQLQQLKEEQEMEKLRQAAREEKLRTISEGIWKRHRELEKSRQQQEDLGCLYQANGLYRQYKSKVDSLAKLQDSNKTQSFDKSENTTSKKIANGKKSPVAVKKQTNLIKQDTIKDPFKTSDVVQSNSVDDSLPIPILRANSPIANNLKHSSVVDSSKASSNSPAMQQVERKWMIPAVKKNILKRTEPISNTQNKNVLTQLGAIRLQLQQEQLRLDKTLQEKVASKMKRSNVNKS